MVLHRYSSHVQCSRATVGVGGMPRSLKRRLFAAEPRGSGCCTRCSVQHATCIMWRGKPCNMPHAMCAMQRTKQQHAHIHRVHTGEHTRSMQHALYYNMWQQHPAYSSARMAQGFCCGRALETVRHREEDVRENHRLFEAKNPADRDLARDDREEDEEHGHLTRRLLPLDRDEPKDQGQEVNDEKHAEHAEEDLKAQYSRTHGTLERESCGWQGVLECVGLRVPPSTPAAASHLLITLLCAVASARYADRKRVTRVPSSAIEYPRTLQAAAVSVWYVRMPSVRCVHDHEWRWATYGTRPTACAGHTNTSHTQNTSAEPSRVTCSGLCAIRLTCRAR